MKNKKVIISIIVIILAIIGAIIYINSKKNIEYEIAEVKEYKYVKYKDGEKYGIIDRNGEIIIDAAYSKILIPNPEKDIFICYDESGKNTVINSKEEQLYKNYDEVYPITLKNIASTLCYEKTALAYKKDGKYGLIDLIGKKLTKNIYDSIENLQGTEGKFQVGKEGKYGVINQNGTTLVDTKYDKVETDNYYTEANKYIYSGFIVSNKEKDGYKSGYVSFDGKEILKPEYNDIIRITNKEKIYLIASKNGQYGLYERNKQIIKPEYQSISCADNGAIILEKNKQYGIATIDGKIKAEPKYSEIEENGIYIYAQNTKENDVYDSNGNKVDINFNKARFKTDNNNYMITTILNNDINYYGIENLEGTELVKPSYKYIEYIFGDHFIAQDDKDKYGIINANGKEEIKFEYDLIQKIKEKNIIQLLSKKSKDIVLYSESLEKIASVENGKVDNKNEYVKVFNEKESIYLDKEGNKIEEDSETVQKEFQRELPETIRQYKKVQISLDDVYYEIK